MLLLKVYTALRKDPDFTRLKHVFDDSGFINPLSIYKNYFNDDLLAWSYPVCTLHVLPAKSLTRFLSVSYWSNVYSAKTLPKE